MIPAFTEALRATTQPCTLLLVLPPLLMAIVTRGRWISFAATCVGAVAGGWLFIANVVSLSDIQLQISGLLVGAAVTVLIAAPHVPTLAWSTDSRVGAAVAGGVAFVATLWWNPCVGDELGAILTASPNGVVAQLPGITAYMLGAMVPVLAAVLVIRTIDPSERGARRASVVAGVGTEIIALTLAVGGHDELVTTLTAWTAG